MKQCDMWPKPKTNPETIKITSKEAGRWLLVVEGQDDAEGAFSLTVACTGGG